MITSSWNSKNSIKLNYLIPHITQEIHIMICSRLCQHILPIFLDIYAQVKKKSSSSFRSNSFLKNCLKKVQISERKEFKKWNIYECSQEGK